VIASLNFQQTLLSVSHDASEIILICGFVAQETFLPANVKKVVLLNMFAETATYFLQDYFTQLKKI